MKYDHRKMENILHSNQTSKLVPQKAYEQFWKMLIIKQFDNIL